MPGPRARSTAGGWTLPEILLLAALLALGLLVTCGLYEHGLDRAKSRQCDRLIAALDRAVRVYHDACQAYPPGHPDPDRSMARVLPALLSVPGSRDVLGEVSPVLLHVVDGRPRCRDPWGQPIRCLTPAVEQAALRRRVEQNGGVPIFDSAGPDRSFGDERDEGAAGDGDGEADHIPRQADNICSDEPLHLE